MGYGAAHLDLILFFRLALAIAFIMLLLDTLQKSSVTTTINLHPGSPVKETECQALNFLLHLNQICAA